MPYANHGRDAPCKCACCRRWMRFGPPTARVTQTRRPSPDASVCTACRTSQGFGDPPTYRPTGKTFCKSRRCPDAVERLGELVAGPSEPAEPEMPW